MDKYGNQRGDAINYHQTTEEKIPLSHLSGPNNIANNADSRVQ